MLYTNLMVTTNKKPIIDIPRLKTKESKYITEENQKQWKKDKTRDKLWKWWHTSNKVAINTYLSIISLNVIRLNAPIKRHSMTEWIQQQQQRQTQSIYMLPMWD